MWHKPCRTFHSWCLCIKNRCLLLTLGRTGLLWVSEFHLKLKFWNFINTLRPTQNGRHLPDDIFKCISLRENVWISIDISLKFIPMGPIDNIPALVQIMAWHRSGDKPLSEPMVVRLPTHICVTRPQWVKQNDQHFADDTFKFIVPTKQVLYCHPNYASVGSYTMNQCSLSFWTLKETRIPTLLNHLWH